MEKKSCENVTATQLITSTSYVNENYCCNRLINQRRSHLKIQLISNICICKINQRNESLMIGGADHVTMSTPTCARDWFNCHAICSDNRSHRGDLIPSKCPFKKNLNRLKDKRKLALSRGHFSKISCFLSGNKKIVESQKIWTKIWSTDKIAYLLLLLLEIERKREDVGGG